MKQTKIAVAGVTAAVLVGAGAGFAFGVPSGAGAGPSISAAAPTDTAAPDTTTPDTTVPDTSSNDAPSTDAPATDTPAKEARPFGGGLKASLDALVAAGTITQEQADAIIAAIEAKRPAATDGDGHGPGFGRGHGDHGRPGGGFGRGIGLDTAAAALGITTDELKTELEAGKTIADVASDKGVDVQTVIDAIVAAETAKLTEQVTNAVNGVKPERPAHMPDDSSTDDTTTTTTG